ncbi:MULTISPECIES: AAA family ATPase [Mycolicibacterium]|uniref:AAA family ATPase n=1 Tax=Mycolicibacterium TaxID=1866885 RepID=UPI001CDB58B0|nr:AAA family ATPase [Mycolicibacterium fortuitum]UBV13091.1 AAA family ATPase [Mycolicibacterium fortuitum]
MIDPDAMKYLNQAIGSLRNSNHAAADRDLDYACEAFSDHCDLHRALAYSHVTNRGGYLTSSDITAIRNTLNTYDEMMLVIDKSSQEEWFGADWVLPTVALILPAVTRGQYRAAYSALLVEQGRYDEARAELDAAARERVVLVEKNAVTTAKEIAAVECLLYFHTSRWEDLLNVAGTLVAKDTSPLEQALEAYGTAMSGTALAHLGSHEAGQNKLRYAVSKNFRDVSAWASLQLGLSCRTAGQEDAAQKAFGDGMQFNTLPELTDAIRNKNQRMRISAADVIAARTSYWDVDSEPDMDDFQRTSSAEERREILDAALAELNAIDGMDEIKEQMLTLSHEIAFENEQRRRGMPVKAKTRHIIFKGPPGTGKTTIANLISRLFYGLGVIRNNTLVSANRATLVAEFEGQSGPKTIAKLNEARGGCIFIDEAYELVQDRPGHKDSFGSESLTALLEYMDNHRDDILVIIAGYPAPIERFLGENPGLKSRFAYSMMFNTYSPDEMWRILTGMAAKEGRAVDPAVEGRFKQIIEIMWDTDAKGDRVLDVAGNGRFARNVFEQAQGLSSRRLMSGGVDLTSLTNEQFMQLSSEDVLGASANILKGFGIINVA